MNRALAPGNVVTVLPAIRSDCQLPDRLSAVRGDVLSAEGLTGAHDGLEAVISCIQAGTGHFVHICGSFFRVASDQRCRNCLVARHARSEALAVASGVGLLPSGFTTGEIRCGSSPVPQIK